MNGQAVFENQIVSKKAHKINEVEQKGKKGKKNRKNKVQQSNQDYDDEVRGGQKDKPGGPVRRATNHDKPSDQKVFKDLCSLLSDYKEGTILKALQETNFDKGEAYAKLLESVPDNEDEDNWMKEVQKPFRCQKKQEQSEERSTSSAPSENANMLMNEVFDTLLKEEINGRQFQELFEQIADMVKVDQKERGVGIIEIDSFVDECNLVKQTLLVGFREELSNFDDFQVDSTSSLYAEIQKFVQNIITKQVELQKKIEEDFPVLDSGSRGKKNIVDRIKHENKKKLEEVDYFITTKNVMPKFARQKHSETSVFNVDNKLTSQKDLISLHRDFQDIPIIDLKFIYKTLAGDYNRTVEFINKHYDQKGSRKEVRQVRTIIYHQPQQTQKKGHTTQMREEQIDKELQHLSLEQLRNEIDHQYKLKQAFQLTKMKIKSTNQRKELDRISESKTPLLRRLSQASRIKIIQTMAKSNPLYVDLHGWRQEEVSELLDAIWRMIKDEANLGNEKIRPRVVRGQRTACLTAMTGKGIHSRGNRSVLKPAIVQWCEQNKIFFEEDEDNLKVYMTIN